MCFENVKYDVKDKIKILTSKKIVDIKKFYIINKNNQVSKQAIILLDDTKYVIHGRLPNYFKIGNIVHVVCNVNDINNLMILQMYNIKLEKLYISMEEIVGDNDNDGHILKKLLNEKIYSITLVNNTKIVNNDEKYKTLIKIDNNNENFVIMDNVIETYHVGDCIDIIYEDIVKNGILEILVWKIYNHNTQKTYIYH